MIAEHLPILAGVDSSEPSAAAVRWAVSEAQLRRRPLWLVHAYAVPLVTTPMLGPPYDWQEDATREAAEQVLGAAVDAVRDEAPDTAVSGELVLGSAGEALVELSGRAHLVVVGDRGHGGFSALLLGSVAAKLAAHASGPVIVARPRSRPGPAGHGAVVVGVDGSVASHAAIGFAFEEADLRGVPLRALHSRQLPGQPGRADVRSGDDVAAHERQTVAQWLRPWEQKYPQVSVASTVTTAHAAGALIEAGRDATMLVVGSRGRGAFTGLLGSVSQQVIHHAPCPVAVVR